MVGDRLTLWAEREAAELFDELRRRYAVGEMAAFLHGGAVDDLKAMIESSLRSWVSEASCRLQAVEAEHRRALDVLPSDWERVRFDGLVGAADAAICDRHTASAT